MHKQNSEIGELSLFTQENISSVKNKEGRNHCTLPPNPDTASVQLTSKCRKYSVYETTEEGLKQI